MARAVVSREDCTSFLAHMSAISRPQSGAPLVLLLFARMATHDCAWLEGGLCVDVAPQGENTSFDVLQDLGVGLRERILPRSTMGAPIDEFDRAIRRIPTMIAPLTVERARGQLQLTASSTVRRASEPAPASIAEVDSAFLLMPPTPGFAFAPPGQALLRKKRP